MFGFQLGELTLNHGDCCVVTVISNSFYKHFIHFNSNKVLLGSRATSASVEFLLCVTLLK